MIVCNYLKRFLGNYYNQDAKVNVFNHSSDKAIFRQRIDDTQPQQLMLVD